MACAHAFTRGGWSLKMAWHAFTLDTRAYEHLQQRKTSAELRVKGRARAVAGRVVPRERPCARAHRLSACPRSRSQRHAPSARVYPCMHSSTCDAVCGGDKCAGPAGAAHAHAGRGRLGRRHRIDSPADARRPAAHTHPRPPSRTALLSPLLSLSLLPPLLSPLSPLSLLSLLFPFSANKT